MNFVVLLICLHQRVLETRIRTCLIPALCCGAVFSSGRQPTKGLISDWPSNRSPVFVGAISETNSLSWAIISMCLVPSFLHNGPLYYI